MVCASCQRPMQPRSRRYRPGLTHKAHGLCTACHNRTYGYVHGTHRGGRPRTLVDEVDDRPTDDEVDEANVWRAVHGERLALTAAERREAVTHLLGRGVTGREAARRLGLSDRTVYRISARMREAA